MAIVTGSEEDRHPAYVACPDLVAPANNGPRKQAERVPCSFYQAGMRLGGPGVHPLQSQACPPLQGDVSMQNPLFWQDDRVYLDLIRDGLKREGSPDKFRSQRFYNLLQAFQSTFDLEGETAEAGCLFGLSTFLMCGYEKARNPAFTGAGHHLFDSFVGLSFPDSQDLQQPEPNEWIGRLLEKRKTATGQWPEGGSFLPRTKKVLADYPGLAFNVGWIPEVFAGIPQRPYRFVHVDVDLYMPTKASFEFFFPQLVPDGLIVVDDYGFTGWPGVKQAVDEFCTVWTVPLIQLTTGNAILLKR